LENKGLVGCAFLEKVKNDWWVVLFSGNSQKRLACSALLEEKKLR